MKQAIVEFHDFTFRYKALNEATLKNINLTIYQGEKILILGASGSGKSTLLNCINGLIPEFYHGEITGNCKIAGIDILDSNVFKRSRSVGTVLQDSDAQFVGLSVGEDIAFALENKNMPRHEMIPLVQKAASIVGMEQMLDHLPYDLSGGQKQKVALAGVLHEDVDILLFDEPLASLDPKSGMTAINLIDQLHRDLGVTVIIIEHRLEDVLYRSIDRIVLIDEGIIVAVGTPDEILSSPVLKEHGIREPLYLSALKDIGGGLKQTEHLDDLDLIDLTSYQEAFSAFTNEDFTSHHVAINKPLIELKHVCFAYDEVPILEDINLTIHQGERIALIGENGAGKSTLAKLLCGIERPQKGNISIEGQDYLAFSIQELAQKIGYVMQNPNQMLVKDIVINEVKLALEARHFDAETIQNQVQQALQLTGLYSMRNWPIGTLSYGQRKRVTIAVILVLKPQCMILDEPTAGQDFAHYTEIMEFIDELNSKLNMTIIFITHDMHLALEYTDRAIVLSKGHCIGDDKVFKVFSDEALIEQASLKKTSLLQLAQRLNLDPVAFVGHFVVFEKEKGRRNYE